MMLEMTNRNEWLGLVRWYKGILFIEPGDSGSVVFAKKESVTTPLGIHVGCPTIDVQSQRVYRP